MPFFQKKQGKEGQGSTFRAERIIKLVRFASDVLGVPSRELF